MRKVILFVFSFFAMILISCSTPPEEKLANHIDEITQIMSENEEDPKGGSSKMYVYSIGKGGYFRGEPSSKETIELNKIKKVTTLRIYIRDRKEFRIR